MGLEHHGRGRGEARDEGAAGGFRHLDERRGVQERGGDDGGGVSGELSEGVCDDGREIETLGGKELVVVMTGMSFGLGVVRAFGVRICGSFGFILSFKHPSSLIHGFIFSISNLVPFLNILFSSSLPACTTKIRIWTIWPNSPSYPQPKIFPMCTLVVQTPSWA